MKSQMPEKKTINAEKNAIAPLGKKAGVSMTAPLAGSAAQANGLD